ncbi:MAG: dihydropteroate synthase [Bacteroidales bacterium]|nr:dihydropteroate synthase [Bacteroidales bacterium]
MTINCNGKLLDLSSPIVAGILNITPDSFYDGGKYINEPHILKRVEEIINEGGTIIDIGAYSSRPGADHVSEEEELNRLIRALKIIRKKLPDVIISVDTFRSAIAGYVVKEFNVDIINDISGGNFDDDMFETIARLQVPYVLMHMKGTPQNMQDNPYYDDLLKEILIFFAEKVQEAKQIGINDLIIDPGFGFGKTTDHNFELLKNLDRLKKLDCPILVGISRKSMVFKLLNEIPENVLSGTVALNMAALEKGANIIRVHDVKEAVQTIAVFNKLNSV